MQANRGQLVPVTMIGMVQYTENARQTVTRLKYQQKKSVAFEIASVMSDMLESIDAPDVMTWIPTSDAHRSSRGFDHAELIARHLAVMANCPVRRLLRRTSKGHQTGQPRQFRLDNVSFVSSPRAAAKRVWVIDDVWTTGATFRAAATALLDSGASVVVCMAYTHVS